MPKLRNGIIHHLISLLILLCLTGCSSTLTQPIREYQLQTPRPFGYVIGDEIQHRILLETRSGIELQRASLPAQGALNRWLHLSQVSVAETGGSHGGHRYQIDLRYQVFYAAKEVKALKIPGFNLRFQQHGQSVEQAVADWEFTIAPLRELVVRQDQHGEYMRPDQPPSALDNRAVLQRFYLALSLALLLAGRLAWWYGYLPGWPKRSVFKRATRKLQFLNIAQMPKALSAVHAAFNALHGKPVFLHKLPDFYLSHPQYRKIATDLEWFFDYSNRYFFGDAAEHCQASDLDRIKQICRYCREIERGSR